MSCDCHVTHQVNAHLNKRLLCHVPHNPDGGQEQCQTPRGCQGGEAECSMKWAQLTRRMKVVGKMWQRSPLGSFS